jgi:hypothetical protein
MKHELSLLLTREHILLLLGLSHVKFPRSRFAVGREGGRNKFFLVNKITRLLSNVQKNTVVIKKPNGAAFMNSNYECAFYFQSRVENN